jgi:uncharacterized membrane protein
MLVPLPIGLWVFSFICDIIARYSADPASWNTVALYTMVGGIVGALAAAVFGLIDLLSLHERPIRKTALAHMGINLTVVALFAVNTWMRLPDKTANGPLWLSLIAIVLLVISGWLGGKLVYTAGVAVDTESLLQQRR